MTAAEKPQGYQIDRLINLIERTAKVEAIVDYVKDQNERVLVALERLSTSVETLKGTSQTVQQHELRLSKVEDNTGSLSSQRDKVIGGWKVVGIASGASVGAVSLIYGIIHIFVLFKDSLLK